MTISLEDNVILVTGSSSGIGRSIAKATAEAGAKTGLHYRERKQNAQQLRSDIIGFGGEAEIFSGDLSKRGVGRTLVEDVVDCYGRLDVLVNNAGAVVRRSSVASASDELYNGVMSTNMRSVFETSRTAAQVMKDQGNGSIVNVSSISARTGGGGGSVLYSAAKAAVSTFTRGLARELAPEGIRVNAISPGYIDTSFHEGHTPKEALEGLIARIPLGRGGTPEDCVGPVLFLASDELSGYVTGQILEVNGGLITP